MNDKTVNESSLMGRRNDDSTRNVPPLWLSGDAKTNVIQGPSDKKKLGKVLTLFDGSKEDRRQSGYGVLHHGYFKACGQPTHKRKSYPTPESSIQSSVSLDGGDYRATKRPRSSSNFLPVQLEQQFRVNSEQIHGSIALHQATLNVDEATMKTLLKRQDIDINIKDSHGHTALHMSASHGYDSVIKLLLERQDVDVNSKNLRGETPLHKAAPGGHSSVIKLLLERQEIDINARDSDSQTALCTAALCGYKSTVEQLLERNDIDINIRDSHGQTVLDAVALRRHEVLAKLLFERRHIDIQSEKFPRQRSWYRTQENRYKTIVKLLLERQDQDDNKAPYKLSGKEAVVKPEKPAFKEIHDLENEVTSVNVDHDIHGSELAAEEKFILSFIAELLDRVAEIAGNPRNSIQSLDEHLSDLFKCFSIELRSNVKLDLERHTTVLICHCREFISQMFHTSLRSTRSAQEHGNPAMRFNDDLTAGEKVRAWNTDTWGTPDLAAEITEEPPDLEEKRNEVSFDRSGALAFVIGSDAFATLLERIKSALTLTPRKGQAVQTIRNAVLGAFPSYQDSPWLRPKLHRAVFWASWDPMEFLRGEYPSEENMKLGDVITLTGSTTNAQAATCSNYMRQTWPVTGESILKALEAAIQSQPRSYRFSKTTTFRFFSDGSSTVLDALGSKHDLAEIGEQYAWLVAACRTSSHDGELTVSSINIKTHEKSHYVKFTLDVLTKSRSANRSNDNSAGDCWHSLFNKPVIAQGFPILSRAHNEKGLEIPLHMMTAIGQTERATVFDNGLLLKGFSTMFVPTDLKKDSVQWHFLCNAKGNRMSYLEADMYCPHRGSLPYMTISTLESASHFVGWSSSVTLRAGTSDVRYDDITWTGSNYASAGCALEKISITGGYFLNAGFELRRGIKDVPLSLRRSSPYQLEMQFVRNLQVLLYDVADRRGWLVDGASALLHLVRAQLESKPVQRSGLSSLSELRHAVPTVGPDAALNALMDVNNLQLAIFQDEETWEEITSTNEGEKVETKTKRTTWRFQNMVREIWHILEQIHDHQIHLLATPGIGLRGTPRKKLEGFGFRDIVEGETPLRPRVAVLKSSGKAWIDFIKQIGAITLMGNGFGELIQPAWDSNALCTFWRHVPKDHDYLAAPIWILEEICKRSGNNQTNSLELTSKIHWHKGTKLFEPCSNCKQKRRGTTCDRVQILLPPLLGHRVHPHPFSTLRGAAVFGRSNKFTWRFGDKGDPLEQPENDNENDDDSEDEVMADDSGIGTSVSTTSTDT